MIVARGIKILIQFYLGSLCCMRQNALRFVQSDLCSDTHCILGIIHNMLGITRIIASTLVKDVNLVTVYTRPNIKNGKFPFTNDKQTDPGESENIEQPLPR